MTIQKTQDIIDDQAAIYIASALNNAQIVLKLAQKFEDNNIAITYEWFKHGYMSSELDRQTVSQLEINGVCTADLIVVLLPGGRGTHIEFGAALALNKPIFLHSMGGILTDGGGRYCSFYSHKLVNIITNFDNIIPTVENFINTGSG